jgi:hypothetical protein
MPLTINGTTGLLFGDGSIQNTSGIDFPSGTLMLFQQTAAPTGWTKQTDHNDKALRVVTGSASSGGSSGFSAVFTSGLATDATTLTTTQMPSHVHNINYATSQFGPYPGNFGSGAATYASQANGGGGSHTHGMSLAVQYVDLIIASKN